MRRLHCEAAGWHVFDRGIRRLLLFRDSEDYGTFLRFLKFALQQAGCELWAYCLMSNHYHLILYGSSSQLTVCMHHLNRLYAEYHNAKYHLGGHVFDGPFRAYRSPTFRLLLWKVAYVFLNPVKAGMCSAPEEYEWSGYRSFVGLPGSPLVLDASTLMSRVDLPLRRAWDRFHQCVRLEMKRPSRIPTGVPTFAEVQIDQFDSLLQQALQTRDLPEGVDPIEVAIYWGRQSGIAPRFMAKALPKSASREVRDMLRTFSRRISRDPSLAERAALP